MMPKPATATRFTATYPGRPDQVQDARRAVARHLAGCPALDDLVLIVSELASNAVLHSASRGAFFTVRAELHADYVWVEAEDLGGPWRSRQHDDRPHGLDVVEALTGPDGWGTEPAGDGGRVVWARLDLAAGGGGRASPSPSTAPPSTTRRTVPRITAPSSQGPFR